MQRAFSLVELSIVLVILGLLTGGILAGQSLIRAAELRSVPTQYQRYVAATHSYRDKYMALPGDMTNATSFWGAAHVTDATCLTTVGTGTQTCNGDGDGQLEGAAAANQYGQMFTFWQHLANAGLIEGTYTGIASSGGAVDGVIGTNLPLAKLSLSGFTTVYYGSFPGSATIFAGNFGNTLWFGADGGATNALLLAGVITPEEMWNIDTKLDDGKPATGSILPYNWPTMTNAASFSDRTATYLLTSTTKGAIFFANAW